MDNQEKIDYLRQFLSDFVGGPNADAIIATMADEAQRLEDLQIAVTDQLTISTSADIYLDKNLAALGITRPGDLGMDDFAYAQMGIQINQAKQIISAVHEVLGTFYGDEAVRANVTCGQPEPYFFNEGDDLIFALENGDPITIIAHAADFLNINQATAREVSDLITRYLAQIGSKGFSLVKTDIDTAQNFVEIFGGAKGPYSFVQILGGRMQDEMEFPSLRNTDLPTNDTVWEITRTSGSVHRFRWVSGTKPKLDQVLVGDSVMIYGAGFANLGISGTFTVTNVLPASAAPSVTAGWFEVSLPGYTALHSSLPNVNPPSNNPPIYYFFTVTQTSYFDLKFFYPHINTSYSQVRYALGWETENSLLKVYMPASTKVVRRDLAGSAHVHLARGKGDFSGTYGDASDHSKQLQIMSDYSFRYPQNGYDNAALGGTVTLPGPVNLTIDYIKREMNYTSIFTTTPHGLTTSYTDPSGDKYSSQIVNVVVSTVNVDDQDFSWLGPYLVDPAAPYTLTSDIATAREAIVQGQNKTTLLVEGVFPPGEGIILFDLNKENQEGPVKYFAAQTAGQASPVQILSISQNGTTVTVITAQPNQAIPGEGVVIAGTVNFNGAWQVATVASPTTYTFTKSPPAVVFEAVGTSTIQFTGTTSTILIDPSHIFQFDHDIGADVTVLSDSKAYTESPDGSDYGDYVTGTAQGRVYAQDLIQNTITALGINLEIIIVYPSDIGLGNQGDSSDPASPPTSDKVEIWGI